MVGLVILAIIIVIALIVIGLLVPAHAQLPKTQCVSTAIASGTGDAIAIPLLPCTETTTLLVLTLTASNTTTTPTISVNGQTPHVILNFDTTAVGVGALATSQHRLFTYDGAHWLLLSGGLGGLSAINIMCQPGLTCVPNPILGNGTIAPERPFDIEMFWPGVPPANAIVRAAITRNVLCAANLFGSVGIAREAATSPTTVNINQVTGGVGTLRGSAVWGGGGTVATFTAAANITLAANDIIEFAFPAAPDATLGDIAITLQCVRT